MGLNARKPVFGEFANNKGADQPAHRSSLISAFVISLLESIISRLATSEISKLVPVPEQAGLNTTQVQRESIENIVSVHLLEW